MSSVPQNKAELLHAITIAANTLSDDYRAIPDELSKTLAIEGNVKGTTISVCDTLAYLIGWGKLVLKWYSLTSQGQPVDFPETGYKWNQLGLLAQHFQKEYKDWHYLDLHSEFVTTTEHILALVNSLDDHALYGKSWYNQWTLGRMIQFNTASPMKNVRTKVRRFKRDYSLK
ncbi:ClbS/DfsB family four-helix bundle protein [Photobacterium nomapromontoriensis]|uniref:ClbS/DfsB family four-helix bundle protein n=1 Tax=Photobacterium nomapromontoriensis TaxID=2910237 RepID=UPI003D0B3CEC